MKRKMDEAYQAIQGIALLSLMAEVVVGPDRWRDMVRRENEAYAEREREAELEWLYP
jgi:hypothetical protein